jgi:hypothetical protein
MSQIAYGMRAMSSSRPRAVKRPSRLCKSDTSIDLVFTDINLIGAATGWDVAECFRIERPGVPILYTSGKLIDPSRCVPESAFIPKPYKSTDILNACQRLHIV